MSQYWKTYKLGDFADVQNGYAFKSKDLADSGIPVIKIKNIVSPNVVLEGAGYYSGEMDDKLEKYVIKRNDFLISMTGSTVNVMSSAVGKMGKYRLDDIALLNQRVGKIFITDNDKADFDYVCHFLNRFEINYFLALNATGSANQANISPTQIKDLDILLPPLPEQKAIAQILSDIDDKIENNLAINKTLEEMAMALYKHWFVDFGPFQDGEFVDSELGEIPKGWEVKRLENISTLFAGGDKPKDFSKEKNENFNIPIFSNGISNEGLYGYTNEARIFEESVTVSARGTIGYVCLRMQPYLPIVRLISVVPNREYVSSKFLFLCLQTLNIQGNGTTQQQLTVPDFKKTKVIKPPIDLINEFTAIMDLVYKKILSNKKENQTLTQLRNTLLPKLISGEVRLKEFEPVNA